MDRIEVITLSSDDEQDMALEIEDDLTTFRREWANEIAESVNQLIGENVIQTMKQDQEHVDENEEDDEEGEKVNKKYKEQVNYLNEVARDWACEIMVKHPPQLELSTDESSEEEEEESEPKTEDEISLGSEDTDGDSDDGSSTDGFIVSEAEEGEPGPSEGTDSEDEDGGGPKTDNGPLDFQRTCPGTAAVLKKIFRKKASYIHGYLNRLKNKNKRGKKEKFDIQDFDQGHRDMVPNSKSRRLARRAALRD